jgi:RNA polymerase sigma-70 factor (ECF subfamily)
MVLERITPVITANPRQLLGTWFADYKDPLYRYLLRLVGNEETAADLLQETFIKALGALERQPPPDLPLAWLYRVAANLAYNALRRQRRFRWHSLKGDEHERAFEGAVATAQSVRACLARLSDKEAEVLLLHEHAGLTCAEIARLSGEKPSTVRVRLSRACMHFSQLYQKEVA